MSPAPWSGFLGRVTSLLWLGDAVARDGDVEKHRGRVRRVFSLP